LGFGLWALGYGQKDGSYFFVSGQSLKPKAQKLKREALASVDVTDLPDNARFRQRGLTGLVERVFGIDRGYRRAQ